MNRSTRTVAVRLAGAAFVLAAALPWVASPASAVLPGGTGHSGDSRAASFDGNVTKCNANDTSGEGQLGAGLPGKTISVTATDDGTYIDITAVQSGYTAGYVVVKGGANGYNVYEVSDLGQLAWLDLHAPLNPNGKPATISHY